MSTQRTFLCHFCTHGCPYMCLFTTKVVVQKTFKPRWPTTPAVPGRLQLQLQLQGCLDSYIAYNLCWYNLCLLHCVLPPLLQSLIPTSCTSQLFSPTSCTTSTPAPHFALLFLSSASETTCINRPVYTAMSRST